MRAYAHIFKRASDALFICHVNVLCHPPTHDAVVKLLGLSLINYSYVLR